MTWDNLIKEVQNLLNSKNLSDPSIRGRALANLDKIMRRIYPEIVKNPASLLSKNKKEIKAQLAKVQNKIVLNGAESSIVNNFYQILLKSNKN